jgi:hypothetical protein
MLHSVRRDNSPMAISLRIRQKELASVVTTDRTVAAWSNQGGHRRFKGNGGGFCHPSLAMAQNRLLATRIIGFAVSSSVASLRPWSPCSPRSGFPTGWGGSIAFLCRRWRCDTGRAARSASSPAPRLGAGRARHGDCRGMGISVARRRHRDGDRRRTEDGNAIRMEPAICGADLRHVVGDDGGYDAADRCSDGAAGHYPRMGSPPQSQPCSGGGDAVCVRLSYRLVRLQPRRHFAAMEARKRRTVIRDDGLR